MSTESDLPEAAGPEASEEPGAPSGSVLKRWLHLAVCLLVLYFLTNVLAPLGLKLPLLKPLAKFVEEHDIEANAYFYTEVAEFSAAEFSIRHKLRFSSGKPPKSRAYGRPGDDSPSR